MAFGWFRAFRSSRLANDDFATRATAFPNLFKKIDKGLSNAPYRKVLGNRVAPVAKSLAVSTYGGGMGVGGKNLEP